jgi:hypothetical protein
MRGPSSVFSPGELRRPPSRAATHESPAGSWSVCRPGATRPNGKPNGHDPARHRDRSRQVDGKRTLVRHHVNGCQDWTAPGSRSRWSRLRPPPTPPPGSHRRELLSPGTSGPHAGDGLAGSPGSAPEGRGSHGVPGVATGRAGRVPQPIRRPCPIDCYQRRVSDTDRPVPAPAAGLELPPGRRQPRQLHADPGSR